MHLEVHASINNCSGHEKMNIYGFVFSVQKRREMLTPETKFSSLSDENIFGMNLPHILSVCLQQEKERVRNNSLEARNNSN